MSITYIQATRVRKPLVRISPHFSQPQPLTRGNANETANNRKVQHAAPHDQITEELHQ